MSPASFKTHEQMEKKTYMAPNMEKQKIETTLMQTVSGTDKSDVVIIDNGDSEDEGHAKPFSVWED